MTKHRMAINFSKLYAMEMSSGSEKNMYGIVLKAIAIERSNKTVPKYDPCAVSFDNGDELKPLIRYMLNTFFICRVNM